MPATPGFDKRLAAAIQTAEITKMQLSQDAKVGRPTIDAWLSGEIPVQHAPVRKVAKALGVSFLELWGDASALVLDDKTRLLQLEGITKRFIELAREAESVVESEPAAAPPATKRVAAEERPTPPEETPRISRRLPSREGRRGGGR